MNDLFDELLSICLDRLEDGDTVADCMADFPECSELKPLLETATALTALGQERHGRLWPSGQRRRVAFPAGEYHLLRTA